MRPPSGSTTQPIGYHAAQHSHACSPVVQTGARDCNFARQAAARASCIRARVCVSGREEGARQDPSYFCAEEKYRTARSPKMYGVIPSSYSLQCGQWLHRHPPVLIPNSQDLISVAVNHQAILTSVNLFATCFRCVLCSMLRCISGTALSCSFQTDDKC